MSNISIFKNIWDVKNGKPIDLDLFLDYVKEGKWQDIVLPIRAIRDKAERQEAKKKAPYVTISGVCNAREDDKILNHSGKIGIDIDDENPNKVKEVLGDDKYVHAIFTSISGTGACVVFNINGEKHREAFAGISEYLFTTYNFVCDPSAVNPSRARYVSFDPHLIRKDALTFTHYPKKPKAATKIPQIVYVQNDFDTIVRELCARRIDITGDYHQWLSIAYALVDKFGEGGRRYFHDVSQFSHQYDSAKTDKQYTACLKVSSSSQRATIGTIYYLAKSAGLTIVSEQTKVISQTAYLAKKGRRSKEDTVKLLKDVEGIPEAQSADIVDQVFDNNITIATDDSLIDQIRTWLKQEYTIERNEVTRKIEVNGRAMDDIVFNDLFCSCKILFDKANAEILQRIVNSNSTPTYNPFIRFFDTHKHRKPKGIIDTFFNTIDTDTGLSEAEFFPDYKLHFGKKWFVSIISAIHGKHSPLMLVLSGNKQGTGKTEFFRRLLPNELHQEGRDYPDYYTESKLDAGKDDEILMTQKIVIMDDEMGGKNKKEEKRLKELLSKQTFSLREPYGRYNIDLRRLAVLCGTTNDNEILNDPTGNRRIIPINVLSIDFTAYNAIDKIDLIIEAYHLYKDGFNWQLTGADIAILNQNTGSFEQASAEFELIARNFQHPESEKDIWSVFMSNTEIKSYLEMKSGQKLTHTRMGIELKRAGYERVAKKINGCTVRGYHVRKVDRLTGG